MKEFLFTYGSLKDPAIQQTIIGRKLVGQPETLEQYTTKMIFDNEIYPALIDAKNKSVNGLVFDILSTDFPALDKYEGSGYKRARVRPKSKVMARVYKQNT